MTGTNQPDPEIVRIGNGHAGINSVTAERVEYRDEAGQDRFLDLRQCARNWGGHREQNGRDFILLPGVSTNSADAWNLRCVGMRGILDDPPWVEFINERRTRFEFPSEETAYADLLGPLQEAGWHTFDAN
jgi:hypothetical protein